MPDQEMLEIARLIRAGENEQARERLRPILRERPTADAWYLAARVASTAEQAAAFLHKALELDPFHEKANAALNKIEHVTTERHSLPEPSRSLWMRLLSAKFLWLFVLGCVVTAAVYALDRSNFALTVALCFLPALLLSSVAAWDSYRKHRDTLSSGTKALINAMAAVVIFAILSAVCFSSVSTTGNQISSGDSRVNFWWARVDQHMEDFLDADRVAMSTPKPVLAPIVQDMQAIRRDFSNEYCPEEAKQICDDFSAYMQHTVDGYLHFMEGNDRDAEDALQEASAAFDRAFLGLLEAGIGAEK